jgi:hypothetical protein
MEEVMNLIPGSSEILAAYCGKAILMTGATKFSPSIHIIFITTEAHVEATPLPLHRCL